MALDYVDIPVPLFGLSLKLQLLALDGHGVMTAVDSSDLISFLLTAFGCAEPLHILPVWIFAVMGCLSDKSALFEGVWEGEAGELGQLVVSHHEDLVGNHEQTWG